MMTEVFLPPDWVMLGAPMVNGFVVVASNDISKAALISEAVASNQIFCGDFITEAHLKTITTLSCELNTWVIGLGDTYEEAFQNVMKRWKPEPNPHRSVSHQPEIGPA